MRADPIRTSRHTLTGSGQTGSGQTAVAFDRKPTASAITHAMLHMRQRCLTAGGMFRLASEA